MTAWKSMLGAPLLRCLLCLALAACGGGSDAPGDPAQSGGSGGAGGDGGGNGGGGTGGTGGTGGGEVNPNLPRIDSVEPNHGSIATAVTVHGAHFAAGAAANSVQFGGMEAPALSVTPDGTTIETAVPTGARSGMVVVLTGGVRVEGPEFTIDPNPVPHLIALEPARVAVGSDVRLHVLGSGFVRDSEVRVGDGVFPGEYLSETELEVPLTASALGEAGSLDVRVISGPPGGGESESLPLTVYQTFDLLEAVAAATTEVRLSFDAPVDATQAADATLYSLAPTLDVLGATVDPGDETRVIVRTQEQWPATTYTVTVSTALRSAGGSELAANQARFTGYRALPTATGTLGGGAGCDSATLSGPAGVTLDADQGYFVVERTGHQVQLISRQTSQFARFLGFDGTASGMFAEGHAAQGCPTEVGSSAAGAFGGPMGQVAILAGSNDRLIGDTGNDRIVRWSAAGAYVSTFGEGLPGPVILGTFGGRIWVAGSDDRLRSLDGNGVEVGATGGSGSALDRFRFGIASHLAPAAVRFEHAVIVTDPENHRLLRLVDGVPTGWLGGGDQSWRSPTPTETCCEAGTTSGYFTRPRGIAVWWGDLWVADEGEGGRLVRIRADGTVTATMLLSYRPSGLAVTPGTGRLWVLGETDNLVHTYN
jgi:hypothetical protein